MHWRKDSKDLGAGEITSREAELISEALKVSDRINDITTGTDDDLEAEIMRLKSELKEAKTELEIIHRNMPGGIMSYDADTGKILYVNEGLLAIFGCTEAAFRDKYMDNFNLFVMKEDRRRVLDSIETQTQFFDHVDITYRVMNLAGEITWINHKATLRTDTAGNRSFFCIMSDTTDLVTTQMDLSRTNQLLYIETERFKLIEEAIDNIEYDFDVESDRLSISKKDEDGERHWTRIDHAVKDGYFASRVHPDDADVVNSVLEAALKNPEKGVVEYRMPAGNDYLWYRLNYASFEGKNDRVSRIVGSAKDVTEEKIEQEKLKTEAEKDGMTGLLNKTAMQLSCSLFLSKSDIKDCHAMFMIDTDNFKSVNDTLGHGVGDDTIRFVARSIINVFRDTDFVGRMGGDEFMVLMNHTTKQIAKERAKKLNDEIRTVIKGAGGEVPISCSIGIAFFAKDGEDYDTLYKAADKALYNAKESGKDCFKIYGEE